MQTCEEILAYGTSRHVKQLDENLSWNFINSSNRDLAEEPPLADHKRIMDLFKDKITILDEADLIAIFGSIDEMKHQIECILLRESLSACTNPDPASENYAPLLFNEIF